MKTMMHVGMIALAIFLLTVGDVPARGGGGGGRGGGGGSRGGGGVSRGGSGSRGGSISRGGGSVSRQSSAAGRSPSVSRPSSSFSRSSTGFADRPGAGARPSGGDLQNFMNVPRPSSGAMGGPGAGSRSGGSNWGAAVGAGVAGGASAEFLQNRGVDGRPAAGRIPGAGDRPAAGRVESRADVAGTRADRAGDRPDRLSDISARQPARIENRQQLQSNRVERRDEVRSQASADYPRLDFWSDHPGWASWRIASPYRWATWGALTGWVGNSWSEPIPYAYGESVYYVGDSVYSGDQVVASDEEYTQQAEQIAGSAPEVAPDTAEWMPLGVFALTQDGQASGPDPYLFLQLAISKEGVISGTLYNGATDITQTVEGMADRKTQRAAWTATGRTRPIMECGVANLTEDTAPVLVHFGDGQTQQWLLVRLEEPAAKPTPT